MKPILFIAPQETIAERARGLEKEYEDMTVVLALLEKGLQAAKLAVQQGVEAIIARGGTARLIEQKLPAVPVIEIRVSPYDVLHAIYQAREYGEQIHVVGFKNIIQGVRLAEPLLGVTLFPYEMEEEAQGQQYIEALLRKGTKIDALLGGTLAENMAIQHQIPTVRIETGEAAIIQSILEARKIVEVARREKLKAQEFEAILHYMSEGVIAIDRKGRIITLNPAGERILGVAGKQAVGKAIKTLIPDTTLFHVIEKNEPELGKLLQIGETKILANRVPIKMNDTLAGAVATFQDITKIQEYEAQIRTRLVNKGHVAKYELDQIIGQSQAVIKAKERALLYAKSNSTVLITGESGTGKELFAQSIHLASPRKKGPFVAVNCAAIPKELLESELFGYEEGAFTGARRKGKPGLFTEAHGGTIFLDEIGEIGYDLQSRLLRVLQEREVRLIGSNKVIAVDVRVIAATNKNLLKEIEGGRFRQDLYYRLNILRLHVPGLQERREDIRLLSRHFLKSLCLRYHKSLQIDEAALQRLEAHSWPGNIRELENVMERLVVLNSGTIDAYQVEALLQEQGGEYRKKEQAYLEIDSLEALKTYHTKRILEECGNNQTQAAKRLGISRTHLWRLVNGGLQ